MQFIFSSINNWFFFVWRRPPVLMLFHLRRATLTLSSLSPFPLWLFRWITANGRLFIGEKSSNGNSYLSINIGLFHRTRTLTQPYTCTRIQTHIFCALADNSPRPTIFNGKKILKNSFTARNALGCWFRNDFFVCANCIQARNHPTKSS